MKKQFAAQKKFAVIVSLVILSLSLVSCLPGQKDATQEAVGQAALPLGLLGAWELVDSEDSGEYYLEDFGKNLEIFANGTALMQVYDNQYYLVELVVLSGDRILFYIPAQSGGLLTYYELDGNHLTLSYEDEYNIYARKTSK